MVHCLTKNQLFATIQNLDMKPKKKNFIEEGANIHRIDFNFFTYH